MSTRRKKTGMSAGQARETGAARLLGIGIILAIGLVVAAAGFPVSTRTEGYVGLFMVVAMLGLHAIARRLRFAEPAVTPIRIASIFVAIFLTARYLIWRVEFTIGGYGAFSTAAGILLLTAELYSAGFALLGYFVNVNPRHRKPVSLPADHRLWPTVDVVVPSYNEPADILEVTLLGALNLDYPGDRLQIHLLDDGGTDDRCRRADIGERSRTRRKTLQALCARLGVRYHTRVHNDHAKAGNINAAIGDLNGELMVILDADHVPTTDFLLKTVGFFVKDPLCFLVQTPHSFINPDPIEKNLGTFTDSPAETELFHNTIQAGLDGWNASFFCGSAAVMRRSALLEVGGIQGDTITEDAETAMILHARGYHSVFLNESLSIGLQPETVMSFIAQRVRWAQGALQLLHFKNPLRLKGLRWTQKLAYLASFSYWFFPFSRIVTILAPSLFLLFGVMVYNATTAQYAIYGMPYVLSTMVFADLIFGEIRWPMMSDVYEMVQTPLAAPALAATVIRPRQLSFRVTPKGEPMDEDFVPRVAWIQYVFLLVVVVSLVAGIGRWMYDPGERPQLVFTMMWELVNTLIVAAAVGVTLERRQQRTEFRVTPTRPLPTVVTAADGQRMAARIRDISMGGARLEISDPVLAARGFCFDERVTVALMSERGGRHVASIPARITRDVRGEVGVAFVFADSVQKADIVHLIYGDSAELAARLARRRRRVSFAQAYRYMARKAARGLGAHLHFVFFQGLRGRARALRQAPDMRPRLSGE